MIFLHGMMRGYSFLPLLPLTLLSVVTNGQPLVPAMFSFGDSVVDVGNNNKLYTIVTANFPPYGRDFKDHEPTGRFCNGKLVADFTTENIGFTSYPPAYLGGKAKREDLQIGANFASASSGYYDSTAKLYHTIPLSKQLEYYKDYQFSLQNLLGMSNVTRIISGGLYLVSSGNSDFLQKYYINPLLYKVYTPDQFSDILIGVICSGSQEDRRDNIAAPGLPTDSHNDLWVVGNERMHRETEYRCRFNKKLNATSRNLKNNLSSLNLVVLNIYQPRLDIISNYGFAEARSGTGLIETSIMCNQESVGTCKNASMYMFWDGFHPTEATNKILADDLLVSGISLIT